jgi:hypothetical protein
MVSEIMRGGRVIISDGTAGEGISVKQEPGDQAWIGRVGK